MGVMKQLKEEEAARRGKKHAQKVEVGGSIVSFRPNDLQKPIIRTMTDGMVLAIIDQRILEGLKLTIGHNPRGDGVYVIVRKGDWGFQEGVAIGFNHKDVSTALAIAAYYLEHVNPEYPAKLPEVMQFEFDW